MADFPPPERLTYGKWLARQDEETQADILGKARAKLFREGSLTVDSFVTADGSPLTLAEIRRRNPQAFARATAPQ
jgi:hypothetical protein